MIMKTASFFIFCLFIFNSVLAQVGPEFLWMEENPGLAREKYQLYKDAMIMEDYKAAVDPLNWLLENNPELNKAIYIEGVTIYTQLEKKETDKLLKEHYQNKILDLYETRIKYYKEEADVLRRMGRVAYNFWVKRDDPEKWDKIYKLYSRILTLNKANTPRYQMKILMQASVNNFKKGEISQDEVFKEYGEITEVIESGLAESSETSKEKWEELEEEITSLLLHVVEDKCRFVNEHWKEIIEAQPERLNISKMAVLLLNKGNCDDNSLYLNALENLFLSEQKLKWAELISREYLKEKNYKNALVWKQKAMMAEDLSDSKKLELLFDQAKIHNQEGDKYKARELSLEALKISEQSGSSALRKNIYSFIGDLYMGSGEECYDNSSKVQSRLCYIKAYEMYALAGNSTKMDEASQQFPHINDIFSEGRKERDIIQIDCWIGGTVELKKRP
ncbi:hypothetical protein [Flexithrix dorotheae]|uniref:hypothetical protein n=1 Tax=Flexithrix dorotheae TaxID=70993 RepID=UPI00037B302C|nr:hypothetical protein [Flexithrix dorotheae]